MEDDLILDVPERRGRGDKPKNYLLTLVLICLVLAGYLFKFMHWPFSGILILFPSLFLCVLFLYRFFTREEKGITEYVMLGVVAVWLFFLYISYSNSLIAAFENN